MPEAGARPRAQLARIRAGEVRDVHAVARPARRHVRGSVQGGGVLRRRRGGRVGRPRVRRRGEPRLLPGMRQAGAEPSPQPTRTPENAPPRRQEREPPRGLDVGDSGLGEMPHLGGRQDPLLDSPQKNVKYFLRPINTGVWALSDAGNPSREKLQNAKNPRLRHEGRARCRRGSGTMSAPSFNNEQERFKP